MAKGGARARSGPPPDPNALRRERDGDGWLTLPADGRKGPTPKWPLADEKARESVIWAGEWKRPQAIEWERLGLQLEVALYVRSLIDAESHEATAAARTLVRQQQEALGISLPGLSRNRWKIDKAPADEATPAAPAKRGSVRDRLKVVPGGGEAA